MLTLPGLEATYDRLAEAIDAAGEAHSEPMLVKLVLLLAQELGDADRVAALIVEAGRDLSAPPSIRGADGASGGGIA
jgi:hypothetical protein